VGIRNCAEFCLSEHTSFFADLHRSTIDDQNFVCADIFKVLSVGSPESAVVKQVSGKHPAATHTNVKLMLLLYQTWTFQEDVFVTSPL
jgi:hypothetical protein